MPVTSGAIGVVPPLGIAVPRSTLHEPLGPAMVLNVDPLMMVTATVLPGSARPVITGVVSLFLSDEVI